MKNLLTYDQYINESANYRPTDFPTGSIIHFKDGEEWIVVEPGLRGSGNRRQSDEISIKPYNKVAKDRNVSMAIDASMKYLNTVVTKIEKK
jgi:hypothetical protein